MNTEQTSKNIFMPSFNLFINHQTFFPLSISNSLNFISSTLFFFAKHCTLSTQSCVVLFWLEIHDRSLISPFHKLSASLYFVCVDLYYCLLCILLGITLDSELKFGRHITGICNKVSQKIHVLSSLTGYTSLVKSKFLMKLVC